MTGLRIRFVAILGWFFLLYNVERLSAPINIASFVYVLTIVIAVVIIVVPWLQQLSVTWLLSIPLLAFFALKFWLNSQIGGENLPITVTEICAIALTSLLARQVGEGLETFRAAANYLMLSRLEHLPTSFETEQGEIYREIRRARNYNRPLTCLVISVSKASREPLIDRLVEELHHKTIEDYVAARTANFLVAHLRDSDIVTRRDDHFVAMLPETNRDNLTDIVDALVINAKNDLGVDLDIGVSTFPDDAVTFERLLERAEEIPYQTPPSSKTPDTEKERLVTKFADKHNHNGENPIVKVT